MSADRRLIRRIFSLRTGWNPAFSGLRYQKPSVFHSFFHTCGKLTLLLRCHVNGFAGLETLAYARRGQNHPGD
jgi:hypothetical protein